MKPDPIAEAVARLSQSTAPKMEIYGELCREVRRVQFNARDARESGE